MVQAWTMKPSHATIARRPFFTSLTWLLMHRSVRGGIRDGGGGRESDTGRAVVALSDRGSWPHMRQPWHVSSLPAPHCGTSTLNGQLDVPRDSIITSSYTCSYDSYRCNNPSINPRLDRPTFISNMLGDVSSPPPRLNRLNSRPPGYLRQRVV